MNRKYNYKDYKTFSLVTIIFFIMVIFVSSFVNYVVDPFDIFNSVKINYFNSYKPCKSKQQRMTKVPGLKLDRRAITAVFVGSSKTDWMFNEKYFSEILNGNVISMCLNSSSIQESIIMAKNSILIHPEIKTVYFGLDFFASNENYNNTVLDVELISNKRITRKEIMPLLFSWDALDSSIKTVFKNLFNDKKYDFDSIQPKKNPRVEHYFKEVIERYKKNYYTDYILDPDLILKLTEFENFAKSKNVNVVFYITPTHVADLINIKNQELLDDYYIFKKLIAEKYDYYDFSLINKYNTEPINPDMIYFRDAVHTTKYYGTLFVQNLNSDKSEMAVYITKENIDKYIRQDELNLELYIKNNPELVLKVEEWAD